MPTDHPQIYPHAIALLVVFLVYRRLRRSFGRQRINVTRMGIRIALLIVIGVCLFPAAARSSAFLWSELAGCAAGALLGLWGARHTRYRMHDGALHYIPHTYSGIVVSLLLVGRLAYRFVGDHGASADFNPQDFDSQGMMKSPATVGLLFVVVGYYVVYYSRVLWTSKHISPEDLEVSSTSTAASASE